MVGTAVGAFSRALCATLNKIRRQAAPYLVAAAVVIGKALEYSCCQIDYMQ